MSQQYDYLTGLVTVDEEAPPEWQGKAVLPFWSQLNNPDWAGRLSRVLYHEAVHFWLFLSSRYLATLVAEEWTRLLHLEETGKLEPQGSVVKAFSAPREPFSPAELIECWARYWDVHSRGPVAIIEEEKIEAPSGAGLLGEYYSDQDFDLVMAQGPSCELYAAPYRWLLKACSQHSLFANTVFPLLLHAALTTFEPVDVFCEAVTLAWQSEDLQRLVSSQAGHSINVTWLECWDSVMETAIVPLVESPPPSRGNPFEAAGYNIIEEGVLASHPVFAQFVVKGRGSNFRRWFSALYDPTPDHPPGFHDQLRQVARAMPWWAPHSMPGQPWLRGALGALVPPPAVRFANYTWYAPWILNVGDYNSEIVFWAQDGRTFEAEIKEVEERARRFRLTNEALALGLAPDALW